MPGVKNSFKIKTTVPAETKKYKLCKYKETDEYYFIEVNVPVPSDSELVIVTNKARKRYTLYQITHKESGICYVGVSHQVFVRWHSHIKHSFSKKRKYHLQRAIKKDGPEAFSFIILQYFKTEFDMFYSEFKIIKKLKKDKIPTYNRTTFCKYWKEIRIKYAKDKNK